MLWLLGAPMATLAFFVGVMALASLISVTREHDECSPPLPEA